MVQKHQFEVDDPLVLDSISLRHRRRRLEQEEQRKAESSKSDVKQFSTAPLKKERGNVITMDPPIVLVSEPSPVDRKRRIAVKEEIEASRTSKSRRIGSQERKLSP